jgi:hypothetical protein
LELKAMKNDQSPLLRSARRQRVGSKLKLRDARYVPAVLMAASMLGYLTFGCEPDLDSLSVDFENPDGESGGTPGFAGEGGEPGTGGTSGASSGSGGKGGSSGSTSGKGGSSSGATGGAGGDSGAGGSSGSSSGTSGSAGTSTNACTNNTRGANESDVDCGGTSDCPRCENNLRCTKASDCESDYCFSVRCAEPTCADQRKNQDETGVDCGGTCASTSPCDEGVACLINEDCASEYCANEVCADHCTSNRREADETDVNCGGAVCGPCGGDKRCDSGPDCESGLCNNNICTFPSCDDDFLNQDESDTDCGGVCVPDKFCQVGDDCNSAADCETYVCEAGQCAEDIVIATEHMLDYMEDENNTINAIEGRNGAWYGFADGAGTGVVEFPGTIVGGRGPTSNHAMHNAGSGFTSWGSGIGFNLYVTAPGKNVYDVSAFAGITFWARSEAPLQLIVDFPDINTASEMPDALQRCTTCDHHWLKTVQLTPEWKRYTVLWTELQPEFGTVPAPEAFEVTQVVSMQWRVSAGVIFDYWVDDIAFLVAE